MTDDEIRALLDNADGYLSGVRRIEADEWFVDMPTDGGWTFVGKADDRPRLIVLQPPGASDKKHDAAEALCVGASDAFADVLRLREALRDTTASLVASVSLLERGGKKAAPSDKMFAVMLDDYRASIERARAALKGAAE